MEEVEVVVAHHERATLRVGDVFLLDALGGSLTIRSEVGRGTTISGMVPMDGSSDSVGTGSSAPGPGPAVAAASLAASVRGVDGLGAWAAIAAVVALAATAQGLSGFGFSLVSIPLLALVVPVKAAVVGGAMLGLLLTGSVIARDHRHVEWRSAGVLFAAALVGMPIGVWVIDRVREQPLQVAIALIVLAFTVLLWRRIRLPTGSLGAELGVGFTSGVLSTSTGMSGPPLVIALQARGVTPSAFRATLAVVFLGGSVVSLLLFERARLITHDAWRVATAGVPGLAVGLVLGEWWFRRVDHERFRSIVLALLVASAVLSLLGALT